MAPEEFMDLGDTDPCADVYVLGEDALRSGRGKNGGQQDRVSPERSVPIKPRILFLARVSDVILQEATAEDLKQRTPSVRALREALERLLEKADYSERPLLKGLHRRQIIAIAAVLLVIVAASNLYHHFIMTHEAPMPEHISAPETSQPPESEKVPGVEGDVPDTTCRSRPCRTRTNLHLAPGSRRTGQISRLCRG